MRIGQFAAYIPEGREHSTGHVALAHNQIYTIRLANYWNDRECDVELILDGKSLGGYRLSRGQTMTLERTPDDHGRFTFLKAISNEAVAAGVGEVDTADRGLLVARFRPGYAIKPVRPIKKVGPFPWLPDATLGTSTGPVKTQTSILRGMSMGGGTTCSTHSTAPAQVELSSLEAGITGLTGHSDQLFTYVDNLCYDLAGEVTINLRLVCESINAVRKLEPTNSNRVPVAV